MAVCKSVPFFSPFVSKCTYIEKRLPTLSLEYMNDANYSLAGIIKVQCIETITVHLSLCKKLVCTFPGKVAVTF
jgi:hypothetical protein